MTNLLSRQIRTRKHIKSATRPRLTIFRSNQHIWAQIIDDSTGRVVASVSSKSLSKTIAAEGTKVERAALVGTAVATLALSAKCESVVFDRGGYRYHGRVKSLADAARNAGLKF